MLLIWFEMHALPTFLLQEPIVKETSLYPAAERTCLLQEGPHSRALIISDWVGSFVMFILFAFVIQASALDALLDDSVMFAKKLRDMGQPVSLTVVEDLPHGFLSLSQLSKETEVASNICIKQIRKIFLKDQDQAPAPRPLPEEEEDTYLSSNSSRWLNPVGSFEVKQKRDTMW